MTFLKKSQGKLKSFNGNTADLILLKAGTNMWVHCDLNEFITLNEQMEEEAPTRPEILQYIYTVEPPVSDLPKCQA